MKHLCLSNVLSIWNLKCDFSHMKFSIWLSTLNFEIFHLTFSMNIVLFGISYVTYLLYCYTCRFAHDSWMRYSTCYKQHLKSHTWNSTCEKYNKYYTCEKPHVKFHIGYFTYKISHVKIRKHIRDFLCKVYQHFPSILDRFWNIWLHILPDSTFNR